MNYDVLWGDGGAVERTESVRLDYRIFIGKPLAICRTWVDGHLPNTYILTSDAITSRLAF